MEQIEPRGACRHFMMLSSQPEISIGQLTIPVCDVTQARLSALAGHAAGLMR